MVRRHELTNFQWEAIKDPLPGKVGDPGLTAENNRLSVNAVLYVLKTGIPWEDLPARYGKANSVWRRYDRWCKASVWQKSNRMLGVPDLEEVQFDSTSIKVHSITSTSRRLPEKKRRPTPDTVLVGVEAGRRRSCIPPSMARVGCRDSSRRPANEVTRRMPRRCWKVSRRGASGM